ncbi:MAG: hypothetical protein WA667_25190 [Candidatus Nitrosopolaris sp.]
MGIPTAFFGSVIVYILTRRKIPKLEFGEFFKYDHSVVTTIGVSNRITFFVSVKNINDKSEGKVKSCTGFITAFGKSYKTIWKDNGRSKYDFNKEAFLELFYIDKDDNTITFSNSISEKDDIETTELPYKVTEDLRIRLESDRGHCPKPKTINIGDIVNGKDTKSLE